MIASSDHQTAQRPQPKPIDHVQWFAQVANDLAQHLPPSAKGAFLNEAQARVNALAEAVKPVAPVVPE
jgi:hypothetical protein